MWKSIKSLLKHDFFKWMTKYALTDVLKNSFWKTNAVKNGVLAERASVGGDKSQGTTKKTCLSFVVVSQKAVLYGF